MPPDSAVVNAEVAAFKGTDAQPDAALNWQIRKMASDPVKPATPQAIPPRGQPGWDLR